MNKSMVTTYGKYYSSGIYSARYNDGVSLRAYSAVKKLIDEAIISGNYLEEDNRLIIKIVDYGCGNGRYFDTFKSIAESFKFKGVLLEITCVDPVIEGLELYRKKLIAEGFEESESLLNCSGVTEEESKVYLLCTLTSENLNIRIRLVKNSVMGDLANETKVIGKQNCGLCMFGVLSHIETRKRRQDTMDMLCSLVYGNTLYSLPNAYRCFIAEQRFFGSRDIVYSRNNEIYLPYHLYTKQEIEADVSSIRGLIFGEISAASIFDETSIMSNTMINMLDFLISEHMPLYFVEYFSKYFLFEVRRQCAEMNVDESSEHDSVDEDTELTRYEM